MSANPLRRAGLVVAGFVMGLLGLAIGIGIYLEAARVAEVRTTIGERLRLARESIERVEVVEERAIRFSLRDVAWLDEVGDTVLAAPRVTLTLDAASLDGDGSIEFYDVEILRPVAQLIQTPDGEWNFFRALEMTVGGQPAEAEEGRPLVFRDVRLVDGRVTLAMPAAAPADGAARFAVNLPRTQISGLPYHLYDVADVQGVLTTLRIGGPTGWRVDVGSLTGRILEPDVRIAQLSGGFEQEGEDGVRFDAVTLRVGESLLEADGLIRFPEAGILYALDVRADPLRMVDLQPIFPNLPAEGVARFSLGIESRTVERLALDVTGLEVVALDSRIAGRLSLVAGGDAPLALRDADLTLDPLRLLALEELGLVEEMPFVGEVRGSVSTADAAAGFADVDLAMTLAPRDAPVETPSNLFATGTLALSDEELRLDGLTVSAQPLYLATLRGLAPEQADQLRGTVRGFVSLGGTLDDLRIAGGDIVYAVGEAPETRLADLEGRFTLEPELRYELSAVAQPIALATLTELFPALPFRAQTVSGPIRIAGSTESATLAADLVGPAGGIAFTAGVQFGEPASFDVEGTVSAFAAGILLRPEIPLEGPVTGRFAARGTTEQFAFDVDLTQQAGRFVLAGSVTPAADPFRFDVSGTVSEFRIGALVGDPQLFPDPMTGTIAAAGGGGEPYRFDIDLQGLVGRIDLAGFYTPGPVPTYEAQGVVVGLDASRLPLGPQLPATALSGSIDIRGRGTTVETVEGVFAFDFGASTVAGLPLDAGVGRVEVQGGVLYVDTLHVQLQRTELRASGSWGLRAPAPEPLRYAFVSPDLRVLTRIVTPGELLPPPLSGSLQAQGEVAGSFDFPIVAATVQGRSLRYGEWRASNISGQIRAQREPVTGWGAQFSLVGDALVLPGIETFQTVRLEGSGTEGALAVGLFARRNGQSDLSFSGLLELEGLVPRGIALQTMALRAEGVVWSLLNPARVRFAQDEGLAVENLVLERSDPASGLLSIDGTIPPTGVADFRMSATGFDLADLRRITRRAPAIQGLIDLDAVLTGPVTSPEMSIEGNLRQILYEGVRTESITFGGVYSDQRLAGFGEAVMEGQRLFRADLSVPMNLSLEGLLPAFELLREAPVSMTLVADSLPFDLIAAMVPELSQGAGVARAEIEVSGTIDNPLLQGSARVDGGAVRVEPLRVRFTDIRADIGLSGNRVTINTLTARSVGTVSVGGIIDFPPRSAPLAALTVGFDTFRAMDNPTVARLTVSGNLGIEGALTEPLVTGRVEIRESTLRVPELAGNQPGLELGYLDVGQLNPISEEDFSSVPPLLGNVRLDAVELSFAESVWLESNEIRVQIAGDLILYRIGEELRVFGALQAVRGTYALEVSAIVREFDVISGRVQFFGTGDLNPSLDILAGYRVRGTTIGRGGDLTILVQLGGTLLSPRIQLTSDTPVPLSEADLISYLIFGRPSFELGGVTRTFAEQILVQEVVGGILATELLERPILRAGLCDWVRVRPGLTTSFRGLLGGVGTLAGAVVECGWELAPDLFLTGQTGIGGLFGGEFADWRLGLEWQIDDQWMWEASYGVVQTSPLLRILDPAGRRYQFSTELRRRWEYGRPRQPGLIDLMSEDPLETEMPPLPATAPGLLQPTSLRETEEGSPPAGSDPS